MKETILLNFIAAAQLAKLKHIFLVVTTSPSDKDINDKLLKKVQATGIPFTCIRIPSKLMDRSTKGYTYQEGIIGTNLVIESVTDITNIEDESSIIYREDVAAICVQAIQSCDWTTPSQRYLMVRTASSTTTTSEQQQSSQKPLPVLSVPPTNKRMDQLWCINANDIEDQLNRLP
jgi:hypothetical protein